MFKENDNGSVDVYFSHKHYFMGEVPPRARHKYVATQYSGTLFFEPALAGFELDFLVETTYT